MDQAHADQYSRIMRFNSKLESLSQTISSEKKTTLGRYEQLLSQLHEKFGGLEKDRVANSNMFNETVKALQDETKTRKLATETAAASFDISIKQLQQTLRGEVDALHREHETSSEEVSTGLDKVITGLELELAQDIEATGAMRANREAAVTADLKRLNEEFEAELHTGEAIAQQVEEHLDAELSHVRMALEEDRTARAATRERLMESIENMARGLEDTLKQETSSRAAGEGMLLELVEATCRKVSEAKNL